MKITFLQDHQSVLSGNSFYKAGTLADLRKGDQLIALGVAHEGWGADPATKTPAPKTTATKPKRAARKTRSRASKK